MSNRRTGVYICHCGGNISDYVDVEKVREEVQNEEGVILAKTAMFTCSDATQQEMIRDIGEQQLDGLVIASCSPKLHLLTFREVAKRAGLNPYRYTQVNIREQCSWAHTNNPAGATEKAVRLVRGGIARTNLTEPLEPVKINTVPGVLIVGGGIAGLRAALGFAELGISVYLVEKNESVGGWVGTFDKMYPHQASGKEIINQLVKEIDKKENITLFTGAGLVEKSGNIGDFQVKIKVNDRDNNQDIIDVNVGAIVIATGFESYRPVEGEYGYGMDGVVTLPEFKQMLDETSGKLTYKGKEVKDVAYIYCVGSRQKPGTKDAHRYCSRYCCNAAVHAANLLAEKDAQVCHYHFYRDMRTYGKYELLFNESRQKGSSFLKFTGDNPPVVEKTANGKLKIIARDQLTYGKEMAVPVDIVVLVTGMVPRENNKLVDIFKLPLGQDSFFNEIHPKLRPVETVMDGIYICGTCQGPKNSSESVASALSAVAQGASILKKGLVEMEPLIASVTPELCNGCGDCLPSCPYAALEKEQGRDLVRVNRALCKGCGGCVPLCPRGALNLKGYTDTQIRSIIDAFIKEIV